MATHLPYVLHKDYLQQGKLKANLNLQNYSYKCQVKSDQISEIPQTPVTTTLQCLLILLYFPVSHTKMIKTNNIKLNKMASHASPRTNEQILQMQFSSS